MVHAPMLGVPDDATNRDVCPSDSVRQNTAIPCRLRDMNGGHEHRVTVRAMDVFWVLAGIVLVFAVVARWLWKR